jgi:hypothetical protein
LARYRNVGKATEALERAGYGTISMSEWAEYESGSRRPSPERRAAIEAFLGATAPSEADDQSDELVGAIRALTRAAELQSGLLAEALRALRGEAGSAEIGPLVVAAIARAQAVAELPEEQDSDPPAVEPAGTRPRIRQR